MMRKLYILFCLSVLATAIHAATPISLHCWVVYDENDSSPKDASDVEDLIADVNYVYSQVQISFTVASVAVTNDARLARINYNNAIQRNAVTAITNNTEGLEVYFVSQLEGGVNGFGADEGIVLGPNASAITLAHEIGHICGLKDIFDCHDATDKHVTGAPSKVRMPKDWGWYPEEFMHIHVIRKLLMYGYSSDNKTDMSLGNIYGLYYDDVRDARTGQWKKDWKIDLVPVGFSGANRNPRSN